MRWEWDLYSLLILENLHYNSDFVCHYIFALWFLLSSFFPRLISSVADWMSAILPHMVWPLCEFKMQLWNVLHAAHCKYRTQKVAKNRHLGTIAQLSRAIFSQLRHISTIGKKLVKQQYFLHMCPQYGELWTTSGRDRFTSLGHPSQTIGLYCSLLSRYVEHGGT